MPRAWSKIVESTFGAKGDATSVEKVAIEENRVFPRYNRVMCPNSILAKRKLDSFVFIFEPDEMKPTKTPVSLTSEYKHGACRQPTVVWRRVAVQQVASLAQTKVQRWSRGLWMNNVTLFYMNSQVVPSCNRRLGLVRLGF